MSEYPAPSRILCLDCGTFGSLFAEPVFVCQHCGHEQELDQVLHMFKYAADAYYYGHQYRKVYERARSSDTTRFHLTFGGEEFAWIMLAALSGVIGNATYDSIKAAVRHIAEQTTRPAPTDDLPTGALAELTDAELAEILDSARVFHNDLDGLTQQVRSAIVEEIAVDAMSHNPVLAAEIQKLMARKDIKPKHRRRFVELLRSAMALRKKETLQRKEQYNNLWSRITSRR